MNIEAVAKNVAAENEKVAYNPTTGTNWCHLPMEIRLKCIKNLDFKTCTHLRATSKTEKALVESKKIAITEVKLKYHWTMSGQNSLSISAQNENGSHQMTSIMNHEKTFQFLERILKMGEIDCFDFCSEMSRATAMEEVIGKLGHLKPIRTRTLRLSYSFHATVREVAKLFKNVENVCLRNVKNPGPNGFRLDTFLKIPLISKTNHLCIVSPCKQECFHNLVRDWIRNDKEVGKVFQFLKIDSPYCDIAGFRKEFETRVVSQDDWKVRIRTNNPSKHILASFLDYTYGQIEGGVISAILPEEEETAWLDNIPLV